MVNSSRMGVPPADCPLVTIAITCHDAESTIRRAVHSALEQSWPKCEIVIVDDGSSDQSGSILRELTHAYEDVRAVFHGVNKGVAAARNTALAEARGEFIAFFDDDDESLPSRLAEQHGRIVRHEAAAAGAIVLCHSDRCVQIGDSMDAGAVRKLHGIGRAGQEPAGQVVADYVLGLVRHDGHSWGLLGSGTLMARTEDLRRLGGYDERFRRCEELDLAVRAAAQDAHFLSVGLPLVTQYITQTADKAGRAELHYRLLLLRKHKPYLVGRRAYLGAWCNMHAQYHRGRHWWWRLWYVAALTLFPWPIAKQRLKHSSVLASVGVGSKHNPGVV